MTKESLAINNMTAKNYWASYWATRTNGGHRSQDESFLENEAREKLFHLDAHLNGGGSMLDFGCGSGDLLAYYAPCFQKIVGSDFSGSMLKNAAYKIANNGLRNVILLNEDDITIWDKINESFDFITTGQVIQYLTIGQVENFIEKAKAFLKPKGKIIFFDIIDPRIYFLFELGIFKNENIGKLKILQSFLALMIYRIIRRLRGLPKREIGYGYVPHDIINIASRCGFKTQYCCSMYYEYRYHLILTPDV
jgi:cyclopropane-fatty-acyl-phospholipid synthase